MIHHQLIAKILQSDRFKKELLRIAYNYPNLKQELFIRNALLEILNEHYREPPSCTLRAFAEKRRVRSSRYDMAIVDKNSPDRYFKVEFKYQFGRDVNTVMKVEKLITHDLIEKSSDLFILIVSEFDTIKKTKFDGKWGIKTNLSRFVSSFDEWHPKLFDSIASVKDVVLKNYISIPIQMELYPCAYHFYFIMRNN
jgi:hypothetical protein